MGAFLGSPTESYCKLLLVVFQPNCFVHQIEGPDLKVVMLAVAAAKYNLVVGAECPPLPEYKEITLPTSKIV